MINSNQDYLSNFLSFEGRDTFGKIIEYLDNRSIIDLSQVNKAMRETNPIWDSFNMKHQLRLLYSDPELRKKMSAYLNTMLPYTFVCVDQDNKTLSVKKYTIKAHPETKLNDIVNAIYSKSISPDEICEVTLTQFGQRSRAEVMEFTRDPVDFTKAKITFGEPATNICAYSWPALPRPKNLGDINVGILGSENPVAGPFAVFDTPKKVEDWTWEKFSPESSFPGAYQITLTSAIGLLRDNIVVLLGIHTPVIEKEDPSLDPNYPGNFF